ncbi:MAG: hypothetical protein ACRYG8_31785, partial [Janthinobacterium lividum]
LNGKVGIRGSKGRTSYVGPASHATGRSMQQRCRRLKRVTGCAGFSRSISKADEWVRGLHWT